MAGLPDNSDLASSTDLDKFKSGDGATIVRQAQSAVRAYCGWHIAPIIESTFKLDGDGGRDLFLPTLEVVEILEVTNGGVPVDLEDVDTSEAGFLSLYRGRWSTRPGKSVVRLKHGYETAPDDVVGVISAVVARAADSPAGRAREQAGQVGISFGQVAFNVSGFALMKHEKQLLDPYRIDGA